MVLYLGLTASVRSSSGLSLICHKNLLTFGPYRGQKGTKRENLVITRAPDGAQHVLWRVVTCGAVALPVAR